MMSMEVHNYWVIMSSSLVISLLNFQPKGQGSNLWQALKMFQGHSFTRTYYEHKIRRHCHNIESALLSVRPSNLNNTHLNLCSVSSYHLEFGPDLTMDYLLLPTYLWTTPLIGRS